MHKIVYLFKPYQQINKTATTYENWQIMDWLKDIEVIDGLSFCIGKYLQDEG